MRPRRSRDRAWHHPLERVWCISIRSWLLLCSSQLRIRRLSGLALSDATQVGRSPLGWGARADVLESDVRTDDRPLEHTAYGAVGGAGGNDKWGVDGLERASRILLPSGESSVPAEVAITPF